jgi:parallel beta-helix repeat protein
MFLNWLHHRLWPSSAWRTHRRCAVRRKSNSPRLEPLEDRLLLSAYHVTNTNDSGAGSLRQAILNVDSGKGGDTITFDIGGGGVQTIQPASALPVITQAVTIDGTTQPGYSGTPLIVLNGNLFADGSNGYGLEATASNVTIRGLDINGFTGAQIRLQSSGGDVITGDYLGTDVTGTTAVQGSPFTANVGLFVFSPNNTIGGATATDRNLISGNYFGIYVSGTDATGNVVQGNYVGTDVTGDKPLANTSGIQVAASYNTFRDNVISGNSGGMSSEDSVGNVIQGNLIGTDPTGTKAVPNGSGLGISSDLNDTIGGTTVGDGNIISGNTNVGLNLEGNLNSLPPGLVIEGNSIGTDITGTKALGNATGIVVGTANVTIGGSVAGAGNLISGNPFVGVLIEDNGDQLVGNRIGTDGTGTKAIGNQTGVSFSGFGIAGVLIGGTQSGAGNVISGNFQDGIHIPSDNATISHNLVEGNMIGTDATGNAALGNGGYGVNIASSNNTIGGSISGAGNVIANNALGGVLVSAGNDNAIRGNSIFANGVTHQGPGIVLASGANNNVAAPTLLVAKHTGSTLILRGVFDASMADVPYVLEFFANPLSDPEGKSFLGSETVTATRTGKIRFSFHVATSVIGSGRRFTATLTDVSGDTSEFSNGLIVRK